MKGESTLNTLLFKMADGDDVKSPQSINTEESKDMSKVIVKLVIPNLTVEKKFFGAAKPKQGESEVDVKFDTLGFEVNASVSKKGKTTKFHYKVNKLPGEIDPEKCEIEYKKDVVILTLVKTDVTTWVVLLSKNGLDQAPSD